ncbi:hypothetical protein H4R21_004286 [Coemansia helicoidea]|uniref:Uncharacterized protein n=1 Tax=Coemansia helicoidea TaxID=1286919 RepID=A0ACC1KZC7_9FUNG|nr:hypothetical protein H4R21_004286 [Coemansia helicoidea]
MFRDLPENIQAMVLEKCLVRPRGTAHATRSNLPLLAVCPQWRRIVAPMVYGHVFVHYDERHRDEDGSSPGSSSLNSDEAVDVSISTNLGLVAAAGTASAATPLKIHVHYLASPLPGWREVVQRLRGAASEWPTVELTLGMSKDAPSSRRAADLAKLHADGIAEVADALTALLPGVRSLELGRTDGDKFAAALYGRLAGHYAGQLQRLHSQSPVAVPAGCQLAGLESLRVDCANEIKYQLPRTASAGLVDLALKNGAVNHSWAPFSSSGGGSRVIEFPRLERLRAEYIATARERGKAVHHRDGHPWVLRLPRLKSLYVHSLEDICPLLEYAALPPAVESVSLTLTSAAFREIADVALPAAARLSLTLSSTSGGDPSGLPAIGRILDGARDSRVLRLAINDPGLRVVPASIACSALTHLEIAGPVGIDTMLAFIGRMPRLARLAINSLDLSDSHADVSAAVGDVSAAVEPLSTSLRELVLHFGAEQRLLDTAVAAAEHVLLRAPALTALVAKRIPAGPVVRFVEAHAPHHPHLRGVELRLQQ